MGLCMELVQSEIVLESRRCWGRGGESMKQLRERIVERMRFVAIREVRNSIIHHNYIGARS